MNTRFNPTANGRLHLGHLYLVLLNFHSARQSGGRFIVRFDDNQPYWLNRLGSKAVADFCVAVQEDLAWMGIEPDHYSYQSAESDANETWLAGRIAFRMHSNDDLFFTPKITTCDRPYPYVASITAEKVAQDYREGIDCLIRGDDLVSEFSLYCYFCELLKVRMPEFYYVPKLLHQGADLSDISKTAGNFKIADCRDRGLTPRCVEELLATCCLRDPGDGWHYPNIKSRPVFAWPAS